MSKQPYNHLESEKKTLQYWQDIDLFARTDLDRIKHENKDYLLFAFAYPSGSGLHVGHVESMTALDILARFKRMKGLDVFFPVGWDAFGLPAENYAIKSGVHPAETTKQAINTFRRQIKRLAISYDWSNEISTSHPQYYRWTQWIFLQLFNKGLAYQKEGKVNWCPSCQTVLANEQVVNGDCERCGSQVIQKDLKQWYFRITNYQDELIEGLDQVDWPEPTKQQQLNWIGKSEGAELDFSLSQEDKQFLPGGVESAAKSVLTVFTTRLDTIFGATFLVISPEKFLELGLDRVLEEKIKAKQAPAEQLELVQTYIAKAFKKTEEDRKIGEKDKTGENTGLKVTNPISGEEIPLYVADYVLANYGTGVVMAVPAHDSRDFAFAKKFSLPIKAVIREQNSSEQAWQQVVAGEKAVAALGKLVNSGDYSGMSSDEAIEKILKDFPKLTHKKENYKLRDWLISRQRYWGTPIPIVYDPEGEAHPVKEEHLPWTLPDDVDFKPTGESPLKSSREFKERVEKLYGKGWIPEYDTMDTFVDSSWYYLRYLDARNDQEFARKERLNTMMPVDFYLIGPEHIVLHLLYSRFFCKFLRDQGYLNIDEPFAKMQHQGMIIGPDGKKMSKSKGNVINPDEIVEKYGADTLRVYEMFMGPLEADKPWDTRAVAGVARFLQKAYYLAEAEIEKYRQLANLADACLPGDAFIVDRVALQHKLQQTIKKLTENIPALKYNTAIASLMELTNLWEKAKDKDRCLWTLEELLSFIKIIAPFAPFITESLYQELKELVYGVKEKQEAEDLAVEKDMTEADLGKEQFLNSLIFQKSIHLESWPSFDPAQTVEAETTLVVQINGKVRAEFSWPTSDLQAKEQILEQALQLEGTKKWLEGKTPQKLIYVPGKLVSLVL